MDRRTVYADLCRYLQEYQWEWGIIHKIVNRWYGTSYTIPELKAFYQFGQHPAS